MKAKELIEKWKSEGVSDDIIRKRLIVLTKQAQQTGDINKKTDIENADELEITQTQLSVPQLTFAKDLFNPPAKKGNFKFIILSLLIINLLIIFIFAILTWGWSSEINELREEIEILKKQAE